MDDSRRRDALAGWLADDLPHASLGGSFRSIARLPSAGAT
jgi:hypothetical protein